MKKILFFMLVLAAVQQVGWAQQFEIRDGQFMLRDSAIRIYAGEMHPARIPREYWQHRIQMAKAMGCNALSIYVMWNYQETAPGTWDWRTESRDLRAFVETARREGMYIILRPGPYVCAEWEFGGFPYWMNTMKLRTDDPAYLDSCRVYLREVFRQVDGLFAEQGGNIIMTQVENELGFFALATGMPRRRLEAYKAKLLGIYREVGFAHTLFTCDGGIVPVLNLARQGHIKGLLPGTNDSKFLRTARHTVQRYFDKKGPYYIPEEYAGWYTHWGDAHMFHRDVEAYKNHIEQLLQTDFFFCYYMIHGGTNFGFMNGANTSPGHEVWPVVTSYDYGAPIAEGGYRTPLYDSLRAVYQRASHRVLPEVPAPIASMRIDSIALNALPGFSPVLLDKMSADTAYTFEQLGQGYGYLVYFNLFQNGFKGKLSTAGMGDYALIYVNDSLVYTIDRSAPKSSVPAGISLDIKKNGTLSILFENMGRFNFGKKLLQNSKGATKGILLNGKPSEQPAMMFRLPFDSMPDVFLDTSIYVKGQPVLYTGKFRLKQTADTYLDMRGFGKGIVIVNGHNLGRYWEIGPQYALYVPGVWLKQGENEIVIFDELNHKQMLSISATAMPIDR